MRPLVRSLASLLAALALGVAQADPGAGPLEVQFRSVAVQQNSVPAIAQDRTGLMWIATSKGLMRYDGYRLRPIELAGDANTRRGLGWVRAMAASTTGGCGSARSSSAWWPTTPRRTASSAMPTARRRRPFVPWPKAATAPSG